MDEQEQNPKQQNIENITGTTKNDLITQKSEPQNPKPTNKSSLQHKKYIQIEKPKPRFNKYNKMLSGISIPEATPFPTATPYPTPSPTFNSHLLILRNRPTRDINDIDIYDVPTPSASFPATPFPTPSQSPSPTQDPSIIQNIPNTPLPTPRPYIAIEDPTPFPLDYDFEEEQDLVIPQRGNSIQQSQITQSDQESFVNAKKSSPEDKFKPKSTKKGTIKPVIDLEKHKNDDLFKEIFAIPEKNATISQCHRSALLIDGKCICMNGLIGDGISNCEYPSPRIISLSRRSINALWATKVIVKFRNTTFLPQGAYCLVGNSVIQGILINDDEVMCSIPPEYTGVKKLCLSFDGSNCGPNKMEINYEPTFLSIFKLFVLLLFFSSIGLALVCIAKIIRDKFLKKFHTRKKTQNSAVSPLVNQKAPVQQKTGKKGKMIKKVVKGKKRPQVQKNKTETQELTPKEQIP